MTSDRPYRDAMSSDVARLRLAQGVGSQFDTSVVAAFEAILTIAPSEYPSTEVLGVVESADGSQEPPAPQPPRLRVIAS